MNSPSAALNPADFESILSARSSVARSHVDLIGERVENTLVSGARAIDEVPLPKLKAQMAVLVLEKIAREIGESVPPQALAKLWARHDFFNRWRDSIDSLRAAFSLHAEIIKGLRELNPEFAFQYLLCRELFYGRLPVIASDLKDTLAGFVHSRPFNSLSAWEQRTACGFRGVAQSISQALEVGPFFIVTGDTNETALEQFLIPNEWVAQSDGLLRPGYKSAQNLTWLPRTGMEVFSFSPTSQAFERRSLVSGIKDGEIGALIDLLNRVYGEFPVEAHFSEPQRRYAFIEGKGPRHHEVRGESGDYSIAFFPAGVLEKLARSAFKADPKNGALLEMMVCRLNAELSDAGMPHVIAKRGGLSTIDLVTADKGKALLSVREEFLHTSDVLIFIGDRIALNGNDVEAINVADISVQVGNEWDTHLSPPGHRILLRSKRIASEGGAAEYISMAASIRRLGLTELFSPPASDISGDSQSEVIESEYEGRTSMSISIRDDIHTHINEAREIADRILEVDHAQRAALGKKLTTTLSRVRINHQQLEADQFAKLELALLKKVVEGGSPVLAGDIKDTLIAFDGDGFEWFPNVKTSLEALLRQERCYLMTGDSLPNLREQFLFPTQIIERSDTGIHSSFPGIHNLYLITRTGLDQVIFNFSTGALERSSLLPGISARDVETITEILNSTTDRFHCKDYFSGYLCEPNRLPGYVDVRGADFGEHDISFAYYPGGVLLKRERERFRNQMVENQIFEAMIADIRRELYGAKLDSVIAQRGGISTVDLTTTTKGTALAQIRRNLLDSQQFVVFIGDTVTHKANDGSTIGIAEITVQVGLEKDKSIAPPPGYLHIHSPLSAREGGTAVVLQHILRAKSLADTGIWTVPLPK